MNIPNLPSITVPLIHQENKEQMHPSWHLFFSQLLQELQNNLSQQGINIPQQNSGNISIIQSSKPLPSFVVNSDTGQPYVAINGVFKQITTS